MCGIAGVLNYAQRTPVAPATVSRMCAAMRHRGPDASGQLFRPPFGLGLGSVRLSIIDIGGGDQPIGNEDGTIWTIFNGEIYNFQDLRTQLQQRGHQFKTRADTEVLVHLYEEKGADLVDDLIGDFAFAIWDDRTGELLLARDRLGVKPLYYADHNGQLAFASTLPALLEGCDAPREIDPRALLSYLTFRCIQAPLSVYRHMRKLPPGHVLTARGHDVRIRQYWRLKLEPDESRPLESFTEELDALLHDAIRRQMVADVPLGAFLSGGLDSSTIVRAMTEFSSGPVKAFSIGFREHRYDESRYYKLLARELGIEHHQLVFEPHLLDDVEHIVQMFGEPCAITSGFPLYYLSKLARQHVTVALSGDGPDEIFAGYELRYRYLQSARRAQHSLPRPILSLANRLAQLTRTVKTTGQLGNRLRRIRKFCELVRLAPEQWLPYLTVNHTPLTEPAALLGLALAPDDTLPYVTAFRQQPGGADWLLPFLYADITVVLPDEMFTKLDCMTMAHSLEGRVPLCDHRIAELAGRIPSHMKFDGYTGKLVFRRAVESRLPRAIATRPKWGFNVPVDMWFRTDLRALATDVLTSTSFRQSGLFNPDIVRMILEEHCAERQNYGSLIWALMVFEIWRRSFGSARSQSAPEAPPSSAVANGSRPPAA